MLRSIYRQSLTLKGCRALSASTVYKFNVSKQDLDTVQATLPVVAKAGTDFTKHFYKRMFAAHPELLNLFNQTNQALPNGQPKKLLKTVAVAAQAAITTGELPGEAIEGICHKHAALNVPADAYGVVGEHILGTIRELLTDDEQVLTAWGNLYGEIANVFITREAELAKETRETAGGWNGKRPFRLVAKEVLSDTITRFKFGPVDGGMVPKFKPGKYLTIWMNVPETQGPHATYTQQPRHYTLALPREPADTGKYFSISVKKQGLVSGILHNAEIGTEFDLSAPYGCFDLTGVEKLWLHKVDAPVVFLSGGVGITPVLAMLESIYVNRPATWLHGSINGDVHAYRERIRQIASVRDHQLIRRVWYSEPSSADGEPGDGDVFNLSKYHYKGMMNLKDMQKTDDLTSVLHVDNPDAQYYMCGPSGFMDAQREALMSMGVGEDRIHSEGF